MSITFMPNPGTMSITELYAEAQQWETATTTPGERWPTPGALAQSINPKIRQTPALELIDQALTDVLNTRDGRLIISMPPQEGKSLRTSRAFPLWTLLKNPDTRVAIASYEQGVARRWGRAIRDDITSTPSLGLSVRADVAAQAEWQLEGHEGGVYAAGIGGALTGRPVDCVAADTYMVTDHGRITAAQAYARGISRILAFDHDAGRAVWRDVEAARRIPGRRVVEIVTASGRTLTCTPDHRVYTSRGYVPAGSLRRGETLVALVAPAGVPVRQPAPGTADGDTEGDPAQPEPVLLPGVHGRGVRHGQPDTVLLMRGSDPRQPEAVLLEPLHGGAARPSDAGLPAVRDSVPAGVVTADVLLPGMRERRALGADGGSGELPLQDGDELRALVPVDAPTDPGTRRSPVRGLRAGADVHLHLAGEAADPLGAGHPPHRRERDGQPATEPDHTLHGLPHDAPQVQADTVALVRHRGDEKVDVYDFQVAGTHNFFADEVLVHNCLIIDDPIKDRIQADSLTYRERVWDWWTDVASTRLAPGAPVVVILTRWHEDDLAGRLLAAEDGHLWNVINIPAEADHRPDDGETDPLGREPGEFMLSARGRTAAQWEAIRVRSGPKTWASLYQGRPSPAEGGLFPRTAWARYTAPLAVDRGNGAMWVPPAPGDQLAQSWDMAFKGTDTSDYVVGGVWLKRGPDLFLLDMVRARLTFTETLDAVQQLTARWPQAIPKLVEDKANGTAVIDQLRKTIPGFIPVQPEGGKEARAHAASPLVFSQNVVLPEPALLPNVGELIEEAAVFPNGKNDDAVDMLTQAVLHMLISPVIGEARIGSAVGLRTGRGARLPAALATRRRG